MDFSSIFCPFLELVSLVIFLNLASPFVSSGRDIVGILLLDLLAMDRMWRICYVVFIEPLTPDFGHTVPALLKYCLFDIDFVFGQFGRIAKNFQWILF